MKEVKKLSDTERRLGTQNDLEKGLVGEQFTFFSVCFFEFVPPTAYFGKIEGRQSEV